MDSGLAALVFVARYHQVAADSDQLRHHFGTHERPFQRSEILRAARHLKLKTSALRTHWDRLGSINLPAIAETEEGRFVILAKAAGEEVLIQDPLARAPETLAKSEFLERWNGNIILMSKRSLLLGGKQKFDISWFIPAILKYKHLLRDVIVASFFIQLFALITPLFFQVMIDKVLVHKGLTTLDVLAFGLIVISLFDVVLNGLRNYVFSHTTNRVDVTLGSKLFHHLTHLPISYFMSRQVGNTVARVKELDTIRNFITSSALTLIIDLFFTIVFFAVLYFYSPTLTWIVLGAIPFYIGLSLAITPILRRRLDEKFKRGAENQAFLTESMHGIETVKSMAVEPQMQRRCEQNLAAYVAASFKATNLGNIANQCAQFINKVVTVLILWIGATLVMANELSIGQLIAFNMIAGRVSGPILKLVQLWQDFQQAGISLKRLGDILNTPAEPGHNPNRTTLPRIQGNVRFENVDFRYGSSAPLVLKQLNLNAAAGEIVGIVGRSGSGKSTLTKLIQRLYLPEAGRVRIDGIDLAQMEPAWLRRQIGVVLQENRLFNGSVKDNIAFVDPSLPIEDVIAAAKLSGAHDFIAELSEGYDTPVGEQGANLSGGQRQRIAIARALISNPQILIFDEATSALDYESERVIQHNMVNICKGRTVFIIAHRLSTVRHADRIVVVENGQIVEDGNHEKLLAQNGYYSRLFEYQNASVPIRARAPDSGKPMDHSSAGGREGAIGFAFGSERVDTVRLT
ncbi:type I secretion system permease/ATPase [Marinobacter sp. M216]|uniref:Type I secretion system permease/ATPase n=1 Tax=Marinobacter albus TaxID=3030833 RepID=A0ABT7HEH7_9GAMM|nr:type I secretion system permease/ATPase [Marinobacter sp. M216]MDK9557905.1 type I secretion system permease/ATPase [Marinobacter sp. M216]